MSQGLKGCSKSNTNLKTSSTKSKSKRGIFWQLLSSILVC